MKALLITPFWRRPNHLSAVRTERFIRWLKRDGWEIVLVRAGETDQAYEQPWGVEIGIRDPLGLHPERQETSAQQATKQYSRSTQLAAALLFNPDPGILWTRRAANHPLVLEHGKDADIVLSSSPPESAHLCAENLAKQLNAKLVVDMRDGWLDEPLKPLLQTSQLQRTREGRLERRILRQADKIFVTSDVWQELLTARLPFTGEKVVVLTNGYPYPEPDITATSNRESKEPLSLLYAGKLSLSRSTQKASLLLAPLLAGMRRFEKAGRIEFMGEMAASDLEELDSWKPRFAETGWSLTVSSAVPRDEVQAKLNKADGLLLLCEAQAAVPAKIYEYLAAAKPLFAVSPKGSAVARMGTGLPHFFHVASNQREDSENLAAQRFLEACKDRQTGFPVPDRYTDQHLSEIFLTHVR